MAENTVVATFVPIGESLATINDQSSDIVYLVRYAAISETGEQISPWSQINEVNQQNVSFLLNGFVPSYSVSSVESAGVGVNLKWTVPDSFASAKFDVYYAWSWDADPNTAIFTDFEYADTVTSNSYYIEIPTQSGIKAKFVKFAVQIPTGKKIINTNALIFQTTPQNTLAILDGGTIV